MENFCWSKFSSPGNILLLLSYQYNFFENYSDENLSFIQNFVTFPQQSFPR